MTHFLDRLVERARGTVPLVEPIIAPRFAPAPVAEIATEEEATPPTRRATQETRAANETRDVVVRQEAPPMEEPRRRKGEPPTRETEEKEETVEVAPQGLLVPLQPPNDIEIAPPPAWTRGSESLRSDVPPHVRSAPALPVVRRGKHQPPSAAPRPSGRPALSASPLTFPNETHSNERPIVRVTIGRIEVRAAPAPSTPPRKPAPRSEPKLTLDAYLKARQEGAR
jgi:hypothetical protein